MKNISQLLALLSTGLLAGSFYYGTFTVIPAFYEVPLNVHLNYRVALMNHNAVYMQLLTLVAIVSPVWFAISYKNIVLVKRYAIVAAVAALLSILITRFGNVPINHLMRLWDVKGAPNNWEEILARWNIYNYVRTFFAFASFAMVAIAGNKIIVNNLR